MVNLEVAKRLKKKNIDIVPGYKLCRRCITELEVIDMRNDKDETLSERELESLTARRTDNPTHSKLGGTHLLRSCPKS